MVDVIAKEYLDKANSDVRHFVPVKVTADGNCLYHSIVLLMNNPSVTTEELRGIEIYLSFILLYSLLKLTFSSNSYGTYNK